MKNCTYKNSAMSYTLQSFFNDIDTLIKRHEVTYKHTYMYKIDCLKILNHDLFYSSI